MNSRFRYTVIVASLTLCFIASGCQQIQKIISPIPPAMREADGSDKRIVNVGFYAHFAPISYSTNSDPVSDGFNTHLGYESDLLTAIEAMEGTAICFSRKGIAEWSNIWLKAAEPGYDLIAGGITILDSRRHDVTGTPRVAFTSGHIVFRQSLLVRAQDADRLSTYASLRRDVKVGVLSGTTGESRLLEIAGIVDVRGVLVAGTRIETLQGTLIADGTDAYQITAAGASASLAGRRMLYPPSDNMPQVIYLGDAVGEAALFEALADGSIDAIARGEIGNREGASVSDGAFVVTALDEQVEYGGFTLAHGDTALLAALNTWINYLTDDQNIGYAQWSTDPKVFLRRAEMWNASGKGKENEKISA
ncbi:MAG: transporter substrate-binding domain-containing protein [Candidatus Poribacteria bacterium]|nr:transporter substrate-binding domain-containing protein [Candidatus Poribacteria bacterium]